MAIVRLIEILQSSLVVAIDCRRAIYQGPVGLVNSCETLKRWVCCGKY